MIDINDDDIVRSFPAGVSVGCGFRLWSKSKLRVKFGQVFGVVFLGKGSGQRAGCLTKRAPDAGDSGAIPSLFLRLSIFPVGRRSAARPSAGNANRWATQEQKQKYL